MNDIWSAYKNHEKTFLLIVSKITMENVKLFEYETEPSLYEDLILSAEKHQVSLSDLWFNTSTMKYYLQLLVETIQTMCTSLHGVCIRQIITTNIYISCLCTHVFIIFHAIFQKSIIQKIKINQTPELKFSISQNFSANMGYYFWQ